MLTDSPRSRLFLLAMDHRDSLLRDVYGITGTPTAADIERVSRGKKLVFDGLLAAVAGGVDAGAVGVLVDERYGAAVARTAREAQLDLAMPIERSGEKIFTLEFGSLNDKQWLDHLDRFDPDQAKVLVRANPDDSPADLELQFGRLAAVSAALGAAGRTFLIELLVPASAAQLSSVGGDAARYDAEVRPELTTRLIHAMQEAGIEPQFWKIEGLETVEAATAIVAMARRDGRDEVRCIVLGRDAPAERLNHWLKVAAPIDGFCGFAIGRSIWEKPLTDELAGTIGEHELIAAVAENYAHFVAVYVEAQGSARNPADA
jgi:myo-inositol catabolism protein IolC